MSAAPDLAKTLKSTKDQLIYAIQHASSDSNWELANLLMGWARQLDEMVNTLHSKSHASVDDSSKDPSANLPATGELPAYFRDGNKLVKVGGSRRGGTYEHRVTFQNYQLILSQIGEMAKEGSVFETVPLVDRCGVPRHEPLIVLAVLEAHQLLQNPRRGRWAFVDAANFAAQSQKVWAALKPYEMFSLPNN